MNFEELIEMNCRSIVKITTDLHVFLINLF